MTHNEFLKLKLFIENKHWYKLKNVMNLFLYELIWSYSYMNLYEVILIWTYMNFFLYELILIWTYMNFFLYELILIWTYSYITNNSSTLNSNISWAPNLYGWLMYKHCFPHLWSQPGLELLPSAFYYLLNIKKW